MNQNDSSRLLVKVARLYYEQERRRRIANRLNLSRQKVSGRCSRPEEGIVGDHPADRGTYQNWSEHSRKI
jgi:DNA-binding transcriptional regulator LsrR (DeoR family)